MALLSKIFGTFINLFVFSWDFGLFILNLITPSYKPGHVVPAHAPGYHGVWPQYVPPGPNDSRSACPMINAMVSKLANSNLQDIDY